MKLISQDIYYPPLPPTCLFDLPDSVQTQILHYLHLQDILNFRATCRETFQWVINYSNPYLRKRLSSKVIHLLDQHQLESFTTYVHFLPYSSFEINLNPTTIHSDPNLQSLSNRYSHLIQRLIISDFCFCSSNAEFEFYNSLTSLKSLHVRILRYKPFTPMDSLSLPYSQHFQTSFNNIPVDSRIPKPFLSSLERFTSDYSFNSFYPYVLLSSCPRLKFISTPIFLHNHPSMSYESFHEEHSEDLKQLTQAMNVRRNRIKNRLEVHLSNLEVFRELSRLDTPLVLHFLKALGRGGISLFNIPLAVLNILEGVKNLFDPSVLRNILSSFKSLRGISPVVKLLEMPELEELEFMQDSRSWPIPGSNCSVKRWNKFPTTLVFRGGPHWPNLRRITGQIVMWSDHQEKTDLLAMLDCVFLPLPNKRKKVEELSFINYHNCLLMTPDHFSVSFPNLQRLNLKNISFQKCDYCRLFLLLGIHCQLLRSLEVETASQLDDATFIGPKEDERSPYFSALKHLKNFSLSVDMIYANRPSDITDKTFIQVFQFMPLEALTMVRCGISKVTSTALKALAAGPFGRTIRIFNIPLYEPFPKEDRAEYLKAFSELMQLSQSNRIKRKRECL